MNKIKNIFPMANELFCNEAVVSNRKRFNELSAQFGKCANLTLVPFCAIAFPTVGNWVPHCQKLYKVNVGLGKFKELSHI
jgi:hypothetical protein